MRWKSAGCICAAMLFSGVSFAQAIEGVVNDSLSGKPLPGVMVSLNRRDPGPASYKFGDPPPATTHWEATTGADGKYEFHGLAAGHYDVAASRAGYGIRDGLAYAAPIQLSPGESATGVRFELTPEQRVSGRLVDGNGKPVPFAWKVVVQERYLDGRRQLCPVPGGAGATNERGEFEFSGVWKGPVFLLFTPMQPALKEWGGLPTTNHLEFSPTWYPGTTDASQATRIELVAGAERSGLEAKIVRGAMLDIRGQVRDHAGEPAKNATLMLVPEGPPHLMWLAARVAKAKDGTFELPDLSPGAYRAVVVFETPSMIHREAVRLGPKQDRLDVRLPMPMQIEGEFIAGEGVALTRDLRFMSVSLHAEEEGTNPQPMTRPVEGAPTKFVVENVLPGKYRITSGVPDSRDKSVYVESIRYGERLGTDTPFDITGKPARIVVTFNRGASAVSGAVKKNGAPASCVLVRLLHADSYQRLNQRWTQMAWTDQKGRFLIEHVPPGDYLAYAFEQDEEGFWRDAARFQKFSRAAQKISVAKDSPVNLELQVTPLPE